MSDVGDKVLEFYAAKSLAEILSEGGTDDVYRAKTEEMRADSILRDLSLNAVTRERFNEVAGRWIPDEVADAMEEELFGNRTEIAMREDANG